MVLPIIERGPIDDQLMFEHFSVNVPAMSPPTPDRLPPDVFVRRVFYGGLPVQMPDGQSVNFWGFFDPLTGVQTFPSAPIRVREGQLVHCEFTPGKSTHTIHWHGIEPTPMNDGVGHHSFEVAGQYTYQWQAAQSGTYFYHCHKNTVLHFEMGMYGGLIIDPPNGPGWVQRADEQVRYDHERIWVADDVDPVWHRMNHSAGIGFPFGTDVGLNNFNPLYHMISGVPSPLTKTDSRVVVNCRVGETLLLRVVNGAYARLRTTIEGLDAEVVELDARPLGQSPHSVYSQPFTIPAGTAWEQSTAQRRSLLVKPTQPGTYKVTFEFINVWADIGKVTKVETFIHVAGNNAVSFVDVQGSNVYGTNAQVSLQEYPAGANHVVIASSRAWPDALSATALAGALNAPLLLTEPTTVPAVIETEIRRLGADRATIVGGPAAVSGTVRTALEGMVSTRTVSRIGGADRFRVAAAVAMQVRNARLAAGKPWERTAFVVSGRAFPDALSCGPLAARRGWPILLTDTTTVPQATLNALSSLGITRVYIVGGTRTITPAVESLLKRRLGSSRVTRIAGLTRYDTSVAVAEFSANNGLNWSQPGLATGESFADALSGGVLQGKLGSPILLTPSRSLDANVSTTLVNNRASIKTFRFFGPTASLAAGVRNAVKSLLA